MTPGFRTYREVEGDDRSALLAQVRRQRERVAARLVGVRRVVAVMSGKGGVGKSYVTTGLALGLAARDRGCVGVLDADLHGPTAARLLGAHGPVRVTDGGAEPAVGMRGIRVFSTDLLLDEGRPLAWRDPGAERFVWRGALETGALREFLSDVAWGVLDVLLVDLPPGAAHVEDLATLVPRLAGGVAVTIPSEESRQSVERAMRAAAGAGIALLGVVENMSGAACPACGAVGPLFSGDAAAELARTFGVPVLGRVPFRQVPAGTASQVPAVPPDLVDAFLEVLS